MKKLFKKFLQKIKGMTKMYNSTNTATREKQLNPSKEYRKRLKEELQYWNLNGHKLTNFELMQEYKGYRYRGLTHNEAWDGIKKLGLD